MSETPRQVFEELLSRDASYNRRERDEWLARFNAAELADRPSRSPLFLRLDHPTDPRWISCDEFLPPKEISNEDVFAGVYGRPLTVEPHIVAASYRLDGDYWRRAPIYPAFAPLRT